MQGVACFLMLHMSKQKQYSYSETCSQANLVNVSTYHHEQKEEPTNIAQYQFCSPYSVCKLRAKHTHFYFEIIPTWRGYYTKQISKIIWLSVICAHTVT